LETGKWEDYIGIMLVKQKTSLFPNSHFETVSLQVSPNTPNRWAWASPFIKNRFPKIADKCNPFQNRLTACLERYKKRSNGEKTNYCFIDATVYCNPGISFYNKNF